MPDCAEQPQPPQELRLKRVAIDTYHENVAYLHRDCAVYRAEGFQALSKIEIASNGHRVLAVLNVVDDDHIVGCDEIGLSEQCFAQMSMPAGSPVHVSHAEPPRSFELVHRKMNGERLGEGDYLAIARDIVDNRYSKPEITAFLVAAQENGMDRDEVLWLTRAMVDTGHRLDWHERMVVDKHCIGGIPGNRTSMIVVPLVAAYGLLCPKTSSRSITSPAGTADTMEVLAEVDLAPDHLHDIVRQEKGCLAWGGTAKLAPVDDILISVERPLGIDSPSQMIASILSKKIAAGSTHLLIDIPIGSTAKVRHLRWAHQLRKLFEYVGERMGLHVEVIMTDGRQPIGNGIGPALEARDVMRVLERHPDAPHDLREKSLQLAGRMIEFDPRVRGGQGYEIARDLLDSGAALAKINAIIDAQGRSTDIPSPGTRMHQVVADKDGVITGFDNLAMARVARLAGAPMDKGAGVDLLKKLGDPVEAGEPVYRIHAEFPADFGFAVKYATAHPGFTVGKTEDIDRVDGEI
ncbi:MAG: thymidine phosphorylase family protein [Gammaproteobacteria bacterium]